MKKIRVHIADDHQVLIDGIIAVLKIEKNIEVVGHSLNGKEVVSWFENNLADILILDINMPKLDGFEVLKELKKLNVLPKTVVLSSYDDVKIVKEVLKIGAMGFVAKNAAAEQIVEAINEIDSGGQYFSASIKEKVVNSYFVKDKKSVKRATKEQAFVQMLTYREKDVLILIAEENTTKEISDKLNIAASTVETHRSNLLKKLNVKSSVGLALFAIKNKMTI